MRPSNKSAFQEQAWQQRQQQQQQQQQQPPQRMGNIINRVFESAGPDGKVRGTPQQIIDKYQALARDAQLAGDRVAAESYLQHSEHYSRLLGEAQRQQAESRSFNQEREDGQRERRRSAKASAARGRLRRAAAASRRCTRRSRRGCHDRPRRFLRHGRADRDAGGPPDIRPGIRRPSWRWHRSRNCSHSPSRGRPWCRSRLAAKG